MAYPFLRLVCEYVRWEYLYKIASRDLYLDAKIPCTANKDGPSKKPGATHATKKYTLLWITCEFECNLITYNVIFVH